jgi:hypothetical protein
MAAFQPVMTIAMAKIATPTMFRLAIPKTTRAGMATADGAARGLEFHKRDQPTDFGLVRHQLAEGATKPRSLVAQLGS